MNAKEIIKELFKKRKLKVDILTIFLLLMSFTSCFIIFFTFEKNFKSILRFSESTIRDSGKIIYEKIDCLINSFESIPKPLSSILNERDEVSLSNNDLIQIMKNEIDVQTNLSSIFVATDSGGIITIFNLKLTGQTNQIVNKTSPIPESAIYALWYVEKSTNKVEEKYIYLDKNFKPIFEEIVSPSYFDSRIRPWYTKVQNEQKTIWTDIYKYFPTGQIGVTVAIPLFTSDGVFFGAAGADLSLTYLSNFVQNQNVGKNGSAYILDEDTSEILLPVHQTGINLDTNKQIVITKAYDYRKLNKKNEFVVESEGERFLCGFKEFPITYDNKWLILVTAPLVDFFGNLISTQTQAVFISIIIFIISGYFIVFFAKKISDPISMLAVEIDKIKNLELDSMKRIESNIEEISIMDNSIAAMRNAIRSFAKFVPKEVIRQLLKQDQDINLDGEKKEIAILFCDIVSFTKIAEQLPVDTLISILSEYFDLLSKQIIAEKGTIDKFMGDSIMAFWGAPEYVAHHRVAACRAALRCYEVLKEFNKKRREEDLPEFLTKFGIDAGIALVGNIGTNDRMNYTAIGDAVNTASRLQNINSNYGTSIIISENVYQHVKNIFITRPIDYVQPRGKQAKLRIYELMSEIPKTDQEIDKLKIRELASNFTEALLKYENGEFEMAKGLFQDILNQYENDGPTKFYLAKLQEKTNK